MQKDKILMIIALVIAIVGLALSIKSFIDIQKINKKLVEIELKIEIVEKFEPLVPQLEVLKPLLPRLELLLLGIPPEQETTE